MGDLKDFYIADIYGLRIIRNDLMDELVIKRSGIIRQIALDSFADMIMHDLILLEKEELYNI